MGCVTVLSKLFKAKPAEAEPEIFVDLKASAARALRNPLRESPIAPQDNAACKPALEALAAIEASFFVIDNLQDVLVEASQIVLSATTIDDIAARSLLAERYDELRLSIDGVLDNSDPKTVTILGQNAAKKAIPLPGGALYHLTSTNLYLGEQGLDLPPPLEAFSTNMEIALVLGKLDDALCKLSKTSESYMRDTQFLIARIK